MEADSAVEADSEAVRSAEAPSVEEALEEVGNIPPKKTSKQL